MIHSEVDESGPWWQVFMKTNSISFEEGGLGLQEIQVRTLKVKVEARR